MTDVEQRLSPSLSLSVSLSFWAWEASIILCIIRGRRHRCALLSPTGETETEKPFSRRESAAPRWRVCPALFAELPDNERKTSIPPRRCRRRLFNLSGFFFLGRVRASEPFFFTEALLPATDRSAVLLVPLEGPWGKLPWLHTYPPFTGKVPSRAKLAITYYFNCVPKGFCRYE